MTASSITQKHVDLLVDALDTGCSLDEAAALCGLSKQEIEREWIKGRDDYAAGHKTTLEAKLWQRGRAAAARWRASRREAATEAADHGRRNAADHLKLLEEAKTLEFGPPDTGDGTLQTIDITNAPPEVIDAAQRFWVALANADLARQDGPPAATPA